MGFPQISYGETNQ